VRADDPASHRTAMQIAHEATQGAAGSKLMVDTLSCQLGVQILRRHARVLFCEPSGADGVSIRKLAVTHCPLDEVLDPMKTEMATTFATPTDVGHKLETAAVPRKIGVRRGST
jgi:hypothetical protein